MGSAGGLNTYEDITKDSSESPFIFEFVSGTVCYLFVTIFGLVNITFHFLCKFVFNFFKLVYLMFQILETLCAFSKSLLQFNYNLVSRGLTVLGQFASQTLFYVQFGLALLCKFFSSSFQLILNLPFLCFQLASHYSTVLKEFFLVTADFFITGCSTGFSAFHNRFVACFASCWSFAANISYYCEEAFKSTFETFLLVLNVATDAASRYFAFILEYITAQVFAPLHKGVQQIYYDMLTTLHAMGSLLASSGQTFFQLISDSKDQVKIIFEQLGEWIAMPFTLKNFKIIIESIFLLFTNIVGLLLWPLHFLYGLTAAILNSVKELLNDTFYFAAVFKNNFVGMLLLILCIVLVCIAMQVLFKIDTAFTTKLLALMQKIKEMISPYWQRPIPAQIDSRQTEDSLPRQVRFESESRANESAMVEQKKDVKAATQTSAEEEKELTICIVCQDEPRSTVLLPCRHLCLCRRCAELLLDCINRRKRKCPLCRKDIAKIMDVYI